MAQYFSSDTENKSTLNTRRIIAFIYHQYLSNGLAGLARLWPDPMKAQNEKKTVEHIQPQLISMWPAGPGFH